MLRLFMAMLFLSVSGVAHACGGAAACEIGERSYRAKLPPDWDGASALPVLLHFHGWGRTGSNVIRNRRIADATDANAMLLLAPDGLGKSWSFWGDNPRDIAFAKAVIADAARRWPLDQTRIFVSGFSYGSAMAWALACDSGDAYAGFLGVAGTLSSIGNRDCPSGPITLRQVHGKKDTVMRPPWGANLDAWQQILALSGCGDGTTSKAGRYQRETWSPCAEGRSIQLDTHPGGHWIPKGWIKAQLSDLLSRQE